MRQLKSRLAISKPGRLSPNHAFQGGTRATPKVNMSGYIQSGVVNPAMQSTFTWAKSLVLARLKISR
jgi:hypothetical protein